MKTLSDCILNSLSVVFLIFCRSALRLHRARPAQGANHLPAAGGAAPPSGTDEEVGGNQTAAEAAGQALAAHHLCHHPDICKVGQIPPSPVSLSRSLYVLSVSVPHTDSLPSPLCLSPSQAGAEGGAHAPLPDAPPCATAPLDPGGGFSPQDAPGDRLPGQERPELHTPAHTHAQGPQAAGGGP